jgi:hypothetical protein
VARATRILIESKVGKLFDYEAGFGSFRFWLRRDLYRRERGGDGFFVLKTNHPELPASEVLQSYLQLQEVERAFRVVKTLLKLRPIYHWRQPRVTVCPCWTHSLHCESLPSGSCSPHSRRRWPAALWDRPRCRWRCSRQPDRWLT